MTDPKVKRTVTIEECLASLQKVNPSELVVFSRQLASVLDAGVPLMDGLDAVAEQIRDKKFRAAVWDIKKDIESGLAFSEALDKHNNIFSPMVINMVRAGEKAGILAKVFDRVSGLLEKDIETKERIKAAVRYPAIVLATLGVAFIIMSVYVIPMFKNFFSSFKTELPLPTRLLMGINYYVSHYWYWAAGLIAVILYLFNKYFDI